MLKKLIKKVTNSKKVENSQEDREDLYYYRKSAYKYNYRKSAYKYSSWPVDSPWKTELRN